MGTLLPKSVERNRTVQASSKKRNRLLEVSLNGPICILKPAEGLNKLVKISKLRYNNTYVDHIMQPIDHEPLGDFCAQKTILYEIHLNF